jgi:hypothetical protein
MKELLFVDRWQTFTNKRMFIEMPGVMRIFSARSLALLNLAGIVGRAVGLDFR